MTDNQMFGRLLRHWRVKRGLSQAQLAAAVSLSRPTITQVEGGSHGLTEANRRAVVAALNLTMHEFYRAEGKVSV